MYILKGINFDLKNFDKKINDFFWKFRCILVFNSELFSFSKFFKSFQYLFIFTVQII